MIVVSDTSPITNLIQIQQLSVLRALFQKVIITPAVYKELCTIPAQQKLLDGEDWIVVREWKDDQLVRQLEASLDKGEAESIALAVALHADYLLIDELRGREIAEQLGLKIVGLLGILLKAKAVGLIEQVKPLLNRLMDEAGFFIHSALYEKMLKLANEPA